MHRRRLAPFALAAAALGGAAVTLPTSPARACGGFFCSQVPVDQSGEQIIFGMHGGTITAQIMINYSGDAADFAWLLPVASQPEITLGTMAAFQQLGWRTRPTFNVTWTGEWGQCGGFWGYAEDASAGGGPPTNDSDGGVDVLSAKDVGPFETRVLEATSTDALVKWLDDNDYAQPPETVPLLDHYVKQGMKFVALRLQKDEPTGAIQPITLTFQEADPCVPLVLTQVAAVPDMPVQLYLFGDARVTPTNWFSVTVNERKIDWVQYGQNYGALVTQAIDEAAGHGFVTEFAGATHPLLDQALYTEGRYDTAKLETLHDPADFVDELLSEGFPRDALMQKLLRQFIPMPASLVEQGVTEQQFYNNLREYAAALANQPFDPAGFVDALEERVITPLRDAQAIFDSHAKLTRLYTTVSPDEMNRDPVFAQNADLPDVSNVHTATAEVTCADNKVTAARLTLPDGSVIDYVPSDTWPYMQVPPEVVSEPAAGKIELVGRAGAPVLVDPDKAKGIDAVLDTQAPEDVLIDVAKDPYVPPVGTPKSADSSGCSTGGALGGLALAWVSIVAMGARRRLR